MLTPRFLDRSSDLFLLYVCLTQFLFFFFFSSLAERAITAVPVTALPYEAIVTSSAMPRFHQAETHNKIVSRSFWTLELTRRRNLTVSISFGCLAQERQSEVIGSVVKKSLCERFVFRNFFFLVSRTRHHSCAGHCFTIRSHCNFFRNATIPPGRIKQQKKTNQTATKQNQQRNTNQTHTENQTPEWKLSSLFLYNVQLK